MNVLNKVGPKTDPCGNPAYCVVSMLFHLF